jgi:hypothetical protein
VVGIGSIRSAPGFEIRASHLGEPELELRGTRFEVLKISEDLITDLNRGRIRKKLLILSFLDGLRGQKSRLA